MSIQISLNIVEKGEIPLTLIPLNDAEDCSEFAVVEKIEDRDNPYLKLKLESTSFNVLETRNLVENAESLNAKLDDLCIRVLEAKKQDVSFGFDEEDLTPVDKPYNSESIRIEPKTMSMRQILDLIKDNDLNLTPDFQRYKVWDNGRKSRLIESILLKIPLPVFYFSEDDEGRYTVVDGLQRLTAIQEFMQNKLKLSGLEYLDSCEGKTYNEEECKIDDRFYRRFNTSQISVNVIGADSPARLKYDIFRRLNTGGISLNSQEIRNCFASESLRALLKKMVSLKSFQDATGNVSDARMQAQELVLRFVMFWKLKLKKSLDSYNGNMEDSLDECVDSFQKESFDSEQCLHAFDCAMQNAYYLFGRQCFRKVDEKSNNESNRSILNKLLFESWSIVLCDYEFLEISEKFKTNSFIPALGKALSEDRAFYGYISYGTNGKTNVLYTLKKVTEIFENEMKGIVG